MALGLLVCAAPAAAQGDLAVDLPAPAPQNLAYVPLPGFPSLVQRDFGTFALAWAVVLPSTAGMSWLIGRATFRRSQTVGLGLAAYYTLTVATNLALGARASEAGPALGLDLHEDGALATVHFPLP
jgi:hypothetical protein